MSGVDKEPVAPVECVAMSETVAEAKDTSTDWEGMDLPEVPEGAGDVTAALATVVLKKSVYDPFEDVFPKMVLRSCPTLEILEQTLLELVDAESIKPIVGLSPVPMSHLVRSYTKAARRFGTSVADILKRLHEARRVFIFKHAGARYLMSMQQVRRMQEIMDTPIEFREALIRAIKKPSKDR